MANPLLVIRDKDEAFKQGRQNTTPTDVIVINQVVDDDLANFVRCNASGGMRHFYRCFIFTEENKDCLYHDCVYFGPRHPTGVDFTALTHIIDTQGGRLSATEDYVQLKLPALDNGRVWSMSPEDLVYHPSSGWYIQGSMEGGVVTHFHATHNHYKWVTSESGNASEVKSKYIEGLIHFLMHHPPMQRVI